VRVDGIAKLKTSLQYLDTLELKPNSGFENVADAPLVIEGPKDRISLNPGDAYVNRSNSDIILR
jgi:hypothetical protein